MRFPFFVAKRYLFSRKNTNAINIISGIAVAVFTVGTAVMIIILSFLNGLEGLVKDLNNSFDPELKITARYEKSFVPDELILNLKQIGELEVISQTLEDNVVVRYGDAQEIARVKGVDEHFNRLGNLDTLLLSGNGNLFKGDGEDNAIFGGVIASNLNVNTDNVARKAALFVPIKGQEYNHLNPEASLNTIYVLPSGIIILTEDSDRDLILVRLTTAQELFQQTNKVTALEIKLMNDVNLKKVQSKIHDVIGEEYLVQSREQQNEAAYRVFATEKWATFAILTLVLMIAAFNTIGALTMLVIEKSKDIHILKSMGANANAIQRIFLFEGLMITVLGIVIGLVLGTVFVWLQQQYGLIALEGSFVESFPIQLKWMDILGICLIILSLGLLASVYPALRSAKDGYATT